jgi:serine phosphatase RsbU (regulator of sigma subunit)
VTAGRAPRRFARAVGGTSDHGRPGQLESTHPLRPSALTVTVLVIGFVVTGLLTASSRISYLHNERRLTQLQTSLTADVIGIAPVEVESRLGEALSAASQAKDPGSVFRSSIATSMAPKGPFATAALELVRGSTLESLAHVGKKALLPPSSAPAAKFFTQAATSPLLVTTRVVSRGVQRIGYGLSIATTNGVLVGSASEQLPLNRITTVARSSPDYGFNVALYFGKTTAPSALVLKTTNTLPIRGTVVNVTVPFGSNTLTLVMSPKSSLAGTWPAVLSWGILILGVLSTFGVATLVERLVRRRRAADVLIDDIAQLYDEQRAISMTLQHSLLPRKLPSIPGVAFAGRYLPGQRGAQVGGDWYGVIESDDGSFFFVIGDVSGRGVAAASVMASLRYTARTLAARSYPPSEILRLTSKELNIGEDGHFATVLVGRIDNEARTLTIASAGHYRPILLGGGERRFVDVPIGLPLGLSGDSYESSEVSIPPGACLLAFTDGLFERRSENIDTRLEALLDVAGALSGSIDDRVDEMIARLVGTDAEDDTALLGIQWLN